MPKGQPFTALCRSTAASVRTVVADLHVHTTFSDGEYTPAQVVAYAAVRGLRAVAITDHDSISAYSIAREAAKALPPERAPEVIEGVEFSSEFGSRELHVLGLFLDAENSSLHDALNKVMARRRARFDAFVDRLAALGVVFIPGWVESVRNFGSVSLGRRHLASLIVRAGHVRTRYEAFRRYLDPISREIPQSHLTPISETIALIHEAGGIACLAHPPEDLGEEAITSLHELGLDGLETIFPAASLSETRRLREIAAKLEMMTTGGSDCHGPEPLSRAIGSRGVDAEEFAALKSRKKAE